MSPEPVESSDRVVKKVVRRVLKKTVARPVPVVSPSAARSAPRRLLRRPSISMPRLKVRERVGDLAEAAGDRFHDAFLRVRYAVEDAWDWVVDLRLPQVSPARGSAMTGALVGLLSVALGGGLHRVFSTTLAVEAGGRWGMVAFALLAVVALVSAERLLSGFGVPDARAVSVLSVLLTVLAVLTLVSVLFVGLASGRWAWLLIPAITAISFVVSCGAITAASRGQDPANLGA